MDTKKVVGYLDIIKNPMDLATIREGILNNKYQSREEFLNDTKQIVKNSEIFNGENKLYTFDPCIYAVLFNLSPLPPPVDNATWQGNLHYPH